MVLGSLLWFGQLACASGETAGNDDVTTGAGAWGAGAASGTSNGGAGPTTGQGGPGGLGAGGLGGAGVGGLGAGGLGAGGLGAGGLGGGAASGGAGGGGMVPPTVSATSPTDASTAVAAATPISVTFSTPMSAATITADTNTTCTGSVQLSGDGFVSCLAMSGPPTTSDDTTFTFTPAASLDSATNYETRVTTAAQDAAQTPLAAPYTSANGFVVRYARTISIDGVNDFGPENMVLSSSANSTLYFSYDDANLYVGVTSPDIILGGAGNKFIYFLFSSDTTLTTGNTNSSDGKAKFGPAGTRQLSHHWKVQIDGPSYTEHRIGNGTDWDTDWGAQGKVGARAAGYFEGSIALTELGNPSTIILTSFTVDYDGDNGNGWLYNMVAGATDGSATPARDVYGYGRIVLPTSAAPNDVSHLITF